MNKYELYKEMRRELAEGYKREIEQSQALLSGGSLQIVNGGAALMIDDSASMAAQGEARKILREELSSTLKVILERYLRNLRTEAANHGIQLSSADIVTSGVDVAPQTAEFENGLPETPEPNGGGSFAPPVTSATPAPADGEDPFDTLIRDIEEEYVARETAS